MTLMLEHFEDEQYNHREPDFLVAYEVTNTSSIGATIYSLNIDMIMNIMKYDTNKRWVIHNFNQQEMGNPQFFF